MLPEMVLATAVQPILEQEQKHPPEEYLDENQKNWLYHKYYLKEKELFLQKIRPDHNLYF
ncbi:MAG: hypothetical protein UV01_C0002G0104 [Parcubacteria group bacterium GW2011_GWA2_42_14]|nr:MAG: hypothetical protein UV01_C0002G0104 [Parcubacteria group bacterium GW2011_GWA2_42_14]